MVLAAVNVTPCAAACGCMISTLGSGVVWNLEKIAVRLLADTLPLIISLEIPSRVSFSESIPMTCLNGTKIRTFWLDSAMTSDSTLYLFFTSNSTVYPLSEYTAPQDICSSLFMATAALAALISSPAATASI
jgi:hypothetical protein